MQTAGVSAPDERVPDRRRLLVDLLAHEEGVPALLRRRHVPLDLDGLRRHRLAREVVTPRRRARDRDDLPSSTRRSSAARVRPSSAGMSEARIASPSSHARRRGATTPGRPPSRRDARRRARRGRRRRPARPGRAHGVGESRPFARASLPRGARCTPCRSATRTCAPLLETARSSWKFSTMPLWITATVPVQSTCGCALASVGAPWVAQRVCPIAVVAGGPARPGAAPPAPRASRPLATVRPPSSTATPAESYPRYSSRRRPSTTIGSASSGPT